LHQAGIFDAVLEAVLDHGIAPVDQSGKLILLPDEISLVALLRFLQHKTQTGIVALVLDT